MEQDSFFLGTHSGQPTGNSSSLTKDLSEVELVPIESLLPGDSPRLQGVDEEHCRRLAEMKTDLPPILVHRDSMRVIDGMHRLRAAQLAGEQTISARFFRGNDDEAFIRAVRENTAHGLPLTLADRTSAATRIISTYPHLSDRAIAGYVGLSDKTVSSVRGRCSTAELSQLNSRVGADGRVRPLDREAGRQRAAQLLAERPAASLREIAAGAGISVGTAHDVRRRIRNGESPIPTQQQPNRRRTNHRTGPSQGNGSTAWSNGNRQTRPTTDTTEIDLKILRNLTNDPALRQTESGRELLRFLHAFVIRADWARFRSKVPPHCAESVIKLARQCGEAWFRFAQDIETGGPSTI
jgi:ParB-like chromosome segregation protein Spo0J